tara:strand:+ start:42063 stop:43559 length:1497 start_codon:yes stop_codon:yes gene_type:complete
MAIKKYIADADTTITNAYKANLTERGVSGNMGQSDILETFSIYAQQSTASSELERILIKFPVTGTTSEYISYDREQGSIPASGSVSFYLRMFNAKHSQTTPKNFNLIVSAVSRSWAEGNGLDMEDYSDEDVANWLSGNISASVSDDGSWTTEGGDYLTDTSSSFTASFDTGFEDMELDITPLVEQWINSDGNVLGTKSNYGVGVHLSSVVEDATTSYYTKKFFARGSQYFFYRPCIEARWDSSKKDDRGSFYYSSSLAPADDNLNTLYVYNYVRGQLKNIPAVGTGNILVSLYSGSSDNTEPSGSKLVLSDEEANATGSYVSTGIYSCSLAFTGSTSLTKVFDVWHSGGVEYFTGTIEPESLTQYWSGQSTNPNKQFVSHIINLKPSYSVQNTNARFRLYTRKKDWSPTIYTVSSNEAPVDLVEDVYYKVYRVNDDLEVISYGTGSDNHTRLSFDASGSYFDLDMSLLEVDNVYAVKFVYYLNSQYVEQSETFKFRVE